MYGVEPESAVHRRDGQPPVADARPDADPAHRHRRARIPPTRLGGDQAEAGGDLRVGVQGGVPRLRQPDRPGQRVGPAAESDEGLRLVPPRHGPRGDRRGGRRRPRGRGARAGGPCRPQPVAHVRDPGSVARLPGVRGGRPEPVPLVRQGLVRTGHPHRHVRRRHRGVRRPHAGARLDALQGAGRPERRAGRHGRPVRGVTPRGHPASAAAGEQGARLRGRRARPVRRRHPAGAAPDGRGDGRSPGSTPSAGWPRRSAHRPCPTSRGLEVIERVADWSGGVLQPADGLPMAFPGGHRRGLRHDRGGRDAGGRLPGAARPGDPGEAGHARRRQVGRHAACTPRRSSTPAPMPSGSRRSRACASTASPTSWTWSVPAGST